MADAQTSNPGTVERCVRFAVGEAAAYGRLQGDTVIELAGDLFEDPQPTGRSYPLADVQLLLPLDPRRVRKVLGIGANFNAPNREPALKQGRWFCKFTTSLNADGGEVEVPPDAPNFNYEGELVLVIGKKGRHISIADAPSYIWGVTAGDDFGDNTWNQHRTGNDSQCALIAKAGDGWGCLANTIVRGLDYSNLGIEVRLNGELNAKYSTKDLNQDPATLINYISHFVTLLPGDLIFTGTGPTMPGMRRQLRPGDVVEVAVEGIGTVRNTLIPMQGEEPRLMTPLLT